MSEFNPIGGGDGDAQPAIERVTPEELECRRAEYYALLNMGAERREALARTILPTPAAHAAAMLERARIRARVELRPKEDNDKEKNDE